MLSWGKKWGIALVPSTAPRLTRSFSCGKVEVWLLTEMKPNGFCLLKVYIAELELKSENPQIKTLSEQGGKCHCFSRKSCLMKSRSKKKKKGSNFYYLIHFQLGLHSSPVEHFTKWYLPPCVVQHHSLPSSGRNHDQSIEIEGQPAQQRPSKQPYLPA